MNLFISFSGGETSAYMTYRLLQQREMYDDIVVLFANTGQENEETLSFVNKCDKDLGFNVVWLEAKVIHEKRKGTLYNIVDYNSASRDGSPFEEVIKKYGIPNKPRPHCTRELKLQPMMAYIKQLGWKNGEYKTAIGIRFDEMQRVSSDAIKNKNIIYPLVDWKVRKDDIREFWRHQDFRLNIHEHYGNCQWCWKKSMRKLLTVANESPAIFDFPIKMESMYGDAGHNDDKSHKRVFFRSEMSGIDILQKANDPFDKFTDTYRVTMENFNDDLDSAGSCSESCDIFSI